MNEPGHPDWRPSWAIMSRPAPPTSAPMPDFGSVAVACERAGAAVRQFGQGLRAAYESAAPGLAVALEKLQPTRVDAPAD